LSQTLIIIGSYFAHKNNLGFIFVALGISIGFSSHITIFISVAALIFYWMIKKPIKPGRKIIFSSLLIIFFGTLPNLVYDITHRFENTHRLLTTFSDSQPENVANFVKILVSLIKQTSFIFIPFGTIELSFIIFFYIIILSIGSYINNKDSRLLLFLIFIFGPALVFIFWSGNFSEYYLMSSMIPFCFLVSLLYKKYANHIKVPLTILALVFIYKNYLAWRDYFRPINLLAMKEVVKLAVDKASPGSFGVSLTTEPGYGFGYKYLFQYYGTNPDIPPKKGEERIITIVVPPGFHGVHAKIEKDGIGLLWEGI